MQIKYEFANGDVSVVEVDDEIGAVISDSRRKEENLERKERYHCYSLEGAKYEGNDYAIRETPETLCASKHNNEEIYEILDSLPEIQKRRFLLLLEECSIQEIARREGVGYYSVYKSIEAARKNLKKFLK